jgi:hypothetical protein
MASTAATADAVAQPRSRLTATRLSRIAPDAGDLPCWPSARGLALLALLLAAQSILLALAFLLTPRRNIVAPFMAAALAITIGAYALTLIDTVRLTRRADFGFLHSASVPCGLRFPVRPRRRTA